jgi:predicted transcriptional regulator
MRKTTIKYAAMLQEVQDSCKKNEKIISKELGRKYSATNTFVSSLVRLGWIEKVGTARYNWKTGDVNLEMGRKLADFINEQTNGKRKQLKVDFKEPKVQQNPKPKKEVKPVKTETVSWFWGLYTKTVKG